VRQPDAGHIPPPSHPPLPEVATTATLRLLGLSARDIGELHRSGRLLRIRQGHHARPDARSDIVRAVRLGGRLTSYSALGAFGVWVPPGDRRLHVSVAAHAHALRDPDHGGSWRPRDDVVVHWSEPPSVRGRRSTGVVPLPQAVRHLPSDLDRAHLVAVLDSAVRQGAVTTAQLAAEFEGSLVLRRSLRLVDPAAESGTESIARIRMRAAGLEPRSQVWFGRHRVDFLLAGRVVVEVDGREFHYGEDAFERDRRKAADLTRRGLHVLHFSYAQVLYDWPTCLLAIRAALTLPA
jgi:very-short-patch-repair endonuclease